MSPKSAAVLTSLLVIVMIALDNRQRRGTTNGHWIPFVWFLIVGTRPLGTWFSMSMSNGSSSPVEIGSSPLDAAVLTVLIFIGITILSKRWVECKQIVSDNKLIMILVTYCFISAIWSDYPAVSLKRWSRGFGTLVMVLVVQTERNALETVRTMFRRCAFITVPVSFLLIKYYRNLGVYYESWGARGFSGVTTGKNQLGRLCLILATYFAWELLLFIKSRKNGDGNVNRVMLLINVLTLISAVRLLRIADSATSLGCLVIGIIVMIFVNISVIRRRINSIMVGFAVITTVLVVADLESDVVSIFVRGLGRDMTLTGRTEIWNTALAFVKNRWIGAGYDTFWLGERLELLWEEGSAVMQAHNGYIDAYLQIGIIGLVLLAGSIYTIYRKARHSLIADPPLGSFQIALLVQFLLYNITEDSLKLQSFFWFALMLVCLLKTREDDDLEFKKI